MSATQSALCLMVVAIEIASAKWVVASTAGGKVRRKVLTQSSPRERLLGLFEEIEEARGRLGVSQSGRTVVGYEAGQEGFWLVRALRKGGYEGEVIDPVSLPVDRRRRRAKTDRLDAQSLVWALWGCVRGERDRLRLVRVPSEEAEAAREWVRERERLQGVRRSCRDRIEKKLRTQGIWGLEKGWREGLRSGGLRDVGGRPLSGMLQAMLELELERMEEAERQLRELEGHAGELGERVQAQVEQLSGLRGIGEVGARTLSLKLFWREFDNARQVGACVGLVGVPYASGTLNREQGISKSGDPRLRATLVELGWLWLRYQPHSALTRWYLERTQGAGKRHRRVMIVALARKLVIALWRYLTTGVVPEGTQLKGQVG